MNKTAGLCGRFNNNNMDDLIGSDNLVKDSMSKMAESWIENPDKCVKREKPVPPHCEKVCFLCFTAN